MGQKKKTVKGKSGPKPETLKVKGNWKDAVKHAMQRGKPPKPTEK
jgi:hypothetical protein